MYPKIVSYPGITSDKNGKVAYEIIDQKVYFAGITPTDICSSTIQASENVITAIAQAENLDWQDMQWFDIQSEMTYVDRLDEPLVVYQIGIYPTDTGGITTRLNRVMQEFEIPSQIWTDFTGLI